MADAVCQGIVLDLRRDLYGEALAVNVRPSTETNLFQRVVCAIRSVLPLPDTGWIDAPFSNEMRRRVSGEWQYRPKTPDEESDFESRNAW